MTKLIFLAVISYLDPKGHELFCDAAVICDPGETTCHAHPIEACPGRYDAKRDELSGRWNMGQCLTSTLNGHDVLGCTTDMRELDVSRPPGH